MTESAVGYATSRNGKHLMTDIISKELYTADVTVEGGRGGGRAVSSDGQLKLPLARPGEGTATNPEQLLAAGWGACFQSALAVAARGTGIKATGGVVKVSVTLGVKEDGVYALKSNIQVFLPEATIEDAQQLAKKTHLVCPYSRATAGNIEVSVTAVPELEMFVS
jgi:Ohr subfamily peroxiredoxin